MIICLNLGSFLCGEIALVQQQDPLHQLTATSPQTPHFHSIQVHQYLPLSLWRVYSGLTLHIWLNLSCFEFLKLLQYYFYRAASLYNFALFIQLYQSPLYVQLYQSPTFIQFVHISQFYTVCAKISVLCCIISNFDMFTLIQPFCLTLLILNMWSISQNMTICKAVLLLLNSEMVLTWLVSYSA